MADLKQLSEEAAEAILQRLIESAPRLNSGEALANLATAYATVVGAMPRTSASPRSA